MATARQAPTTFERVISRYPPNIQSLARAARQYVIDFMPGVYEIVWPVMKIAGYGTGPKKMTEHFVWIAPYTKHVVFGFYYGGELPDPKGLLEGTGAKMRHVKLRSEEDLARPELKKLLVAASKHRVPKLRDDAEDDLAAARKAALGAKANKSRGPSVRKRPKPAH